MIVLVGYGVSVTVDVAVLAGVSVGGTGVSVGMAAAVSVSCAENVSTTEVSIGPISAVGVEVITMIHGVAVAPGCVSPGLYVQELKISPIKIKENVRKSDVFFIG